MTSVSSPLSHPSVLTVSRDYHCSLPLINSLISEILCVWKFFSNSRWDCHDSFLLGVVWFQVSPFQSIIQSILPPPSFLPSSTFVTPSWSHWKESPSPVRTCRGSLCTLSMPPHPDSPLTVHLLLIGVSNQCYFSTFLLKMRWQMKTHPEDVIGTQEPEMLGSLWDMPGHKDLGIQEKERQILWEIIRQSFLQEKSASHSPKIFCEIKENDCVCVCVCVCVC